MVADAEAAAAAEEAAKNVNVVDELMGKVNLGAGLGLGAIWLIVMARWLLKKKTAGAAA